MWFDWKTSMLEKISKVVGEDGARDLEILMQREAAIPPKVAVVGQAGVGKTTTINNLFNVSWKTSHVFAGTTCEQRENFQFAGGGELTVVDMPGLGEDLRRDPEYLKIYQDVLPGCDVILWIIQADLRTLAEDQRMWMSLTSGRMVGRQQRIVIGVNQVDKIGPGEWDTRLNFPSPEQENSIKRRCKDIRTKLSDVGIRPKHVAYYSAYRRYGLYDLLSSIVGAAGVAGWKFQISPADPFDMADPDIMEYAKSMRQRGRKCAHGE